MTIRTAISVSKPFTFRNPDDIQPAGGYLLDTDEELIEGLSGLAYCRVTTFLHLPSISRQQSRAELRSVNPAKLDAAVEKSLNWQSSVRGSPPHTLCLKYLTGKTHERAPLLHWTASELRWSTSDISEAVWSLYHHEAFATSGRGIAISHQE
jgi:hypothetical protein